MKQFAFLCCSHAIRNYLTLLPSKKNSADFYEVVAVCSALFSSISSSSAISALSNSMGVSLRACYALQGAFQCVAGEDDRAIADLFSAAGGWGDDFADFALEMAEMRDGDEKSSKIASGRSFLKNVSRTLGGRSGFVSSPGP